MDFKVNVKNVPALLPSVVFLGTVLTQILKVKEGLRWSVLCLCKVGFPPFILPS